MKFRKEHSIVQRQNKSGDWTFMVRIRTENGDVCKSFSERNYASAKIAFETAVNYRNRTIYEFGAGLIARKNDSTVEDMFEYYLDNTTDSYRTKVYHQKLFGKYITFKDTKVQQLSKAMVQECLNKMVEIASDDTIARVFSLIKSDIVGSAQIQDILVSDPTLGVRKPKSRLVTVKRDVVTDRETILKVEECIHKRVSNRYDARIIVCLIEVLYYTGMRPAEVEVLTRDDIKGNYISVTKELGSSMHEEDVVRNPKTPTSVRNVPIHQNLKPILNDLMEYSRYDNLFAKHDGSYMNSTWLGNIIRRVCKLEGIEFNLYRLRHNMATSLVTNNVDSRTTMELLGHAQYGMSLYYASSSDELKNEAIELIH